MITFNDDKVTAKKLAQELLADGVALTRGYWGEKHGVNWEGMTEREREQVDQQMEKLADRIARLLGFQSSWTG